MLRSAYFQLVVNVVILLFPMICCRLQSQFKTKDLYHLNLSFNHLTSSKKRKKTVHILGYQLNISFSGTESVVNVMTEVDIPVYIAKAAHECDTQDQKSFGFF